MLSLRVKYSRCIFLEENVEFDFEFSSDHFDDRSCSQGVEMQIKTGCCQFRFIELSVQRVWTQNNGVFRGNEHCSLRRFAMSFDALLDQEREAVGDR